LFEGDIEEIRLIRDAKTGKSKGFAYVQFKDVSSYERALKTPSGKLIVEPMKSKEAQHKH
jgi:RNA recognition motif-containing protein